VLRWIAKLENDRYLGIEALNLMGRKVPARIEDQPVNAGVQYDFFRNKIGDPAIFVSGSFADQLPTTRYFDFQSNRHACGWPPLCCVENMCGDCAHWLRSFSNLRRVIFRCSSAATRNSVTGSFCMRTFKLLSISSGLLPLAQTMKMKPKRFSYF